MSLELAKNSLAKLVVQEKEYCYYSLPKMASFLGDIDRLPKSMKVLLENFSKAY